MSTPKPWFALPDPPASCEPVVVLGAGLAGCHTAFELAQRNVRVLLLDASHRVAGGASSNPIGIVKPFVTRSSNEANHFYITAFDYLLDRLERNIQLREQAKFHACGVLQLLERRFPASPNYRLCNSKDASKIAGLPINKDAIFFPRGGHLNPHTLCKAMVEHPNIEVQLNTYVSHIDRIDAQWQLTTHQNSQPSSLINCTTLILATGEQLSLFKQTQELPITAARGQTSCFKTNASNSLQTVVTGQCYAIPQNQNVVVGATFTRNNNDKTIADAEHSQNFNGLKALLPSLPVQQKTISGFCGIRATTPDRFPVVGPVPDFEAYRQDYALIKHGLPDNRFTQARYQKNLYVIGGFGSRGIVSTPYCAMLLAQQLCQKTTLTQPTEAQNTLAKWPTLLHPGRFAIRSLKRSNPLVYSELYE